MPRSKKLYLPRQDVCTAVVLGDIEAFSGILVADLDSVAASDLLKNNQSCLISPCLTNLNEKLCLELGFVMVGKHLIHLLPTLFHLQALKF